MVLLGAAFVLVGVGLELLCAALVLALVPVRIVSALVSYWGMENDFSIGYPLFDLILERLGLPLSYPCATLGSFEICCLKTLA